MPPALGASRDSTSLNVVIVDDHDALRRGMELLLLKTGDPDELEQAIRTFAAGGECLDPRLTHLLARGGSGRTRILSPREREVLELLSKGLSGEQAAKDLYICRRRPTR